VAEDFSWLIVPVEPTFGKDARIELMQLMGFVVQHLSLEQLAGHEEQSTMVGAMCELLHSLHEGSKTLFQSRRVREEE
jgi:hypothetical protein